MPKDQVFLDPETGLKRRHQDRPLGAGERYSTRGWCGWEVYHCLHEDCAYDTFYTDHFDVHYYQRHELPDVQEQAFRDYATAQRERVPLRQEPATLIPIIGTKGTVRE